MARLSKYEQDEIVVELSTHIEEMDEEEWDAKYNQLDSRHKNAVDEDVAAFADNAIGSSIWRMGTDFEDY